MIKSAQTFGSASHTSCVSKAEVVLKPACSNLLLYKFTRDEPSSTRKTFLASAVVFAVAIISFLLGCNGTRLEPGPESVHLTRISITTAIVMDSRSWFREFNL